MVDNAETIEESGLAILDLILNGNSKTVKNTENYSIPTEMKSPKEMGLKFVGNSIYKDTATEIVNLIMGT